MNTKLTLAVIVILLLLYVVFKAITTNYATLGTMQTWKNQTTLTGSNIGTLKINSAISIWFYIKEWPSSGGKIIQFLNSNVILAMAELDSKTNTVKVTPRTGSPTCDISDFPLQKWVNFIISFNGSAMDIYLDGKLIKSCVVNLGSQLNNTNSIILGDSSTTVDIGFITNVKLKQSPISPQEAWDLYSQGFGGSPWSDLLNKYKLKLSFIVDNQEQATVST